MEKPLSIFSAYRQVCENSKKIAPIDRQSFNEKIDIDGAVSEKNVMGVGGVVNDRYTTDISKHINSKYSDKVLVSPFYKTSSKCNAQSGIFSEDLSCVEAALNQGVSTNTMVQSKLIPLGYTDYGAFEDSRIDIGQVDALIWHCYMGRDQSVRAILKVGYKPKRHYSGFSPTTAAIRGRNLQCLKLILAIPEIRRTINDKDGFGQRPIQVAASIEGIDPYEFARDIIRAGGNDCGYKNGEYSALMLCLIRKGGGIWTPNIFGELLTVSDLDYTTKDGETVTSLATKINNHDALRMIENYKHLHHGHKNCSSNSTTFNDAILNNDIAF